MVVSTLRLAVRWLQSATCRRAIETWRHYRRLLRWQRDQLAAAGRDEIQDALREVLDAVVAGHPSNAVARATERLRESGELWFQRVPRLRLRLRDGFEVFLITLLAVVTIRTFFVMPTAIPTGSMQPTLYGIMVENLPATNAVRTVEGTLARWTAKLLFGRDHYRVVARARGRLEEILPPEPLLRWLRFPGLTRQRFRVGAEWYSLTPAPRNLPNPTGMPEEQLLFAYAGVNPDRTYEPGDVLVNTVVTSGDHLLVDRFTYHWRRPRRGEILVFQPEGIQELEDDTYFIKRLVGLPNERVRIDDDRRVWIDGSPIDENAKGFRKLYRFAGIPSEGAYSGHLNERTALRYRRSARGLAPLFRNGRVERVIPARHYFLLGDNSLSSLDSRLWGPLPEWQVAGRAWCVYWPMSSRRGFGFE